MALGWRRLAAAMVLLSLSHCAGAPEPQPVSAAAVWHPPDGFMRQFHARCDGRSGKAFTDCFVGAMTEAGAGPAAVGFARRLGGDGYLRAFQDTGRVDVAYVDVPFAANENWKWLLANGTTPLVDVDDLRLLDLGAMRAAPAYRALQRRFPRVMLWPGDRGSPPGPEERAIAEGGQMFVVPYRLQDGCHACAVIGEVRFGFVFDAAGSFLGTRLLSVVEAAR